MQAQQRYILPSDLSEALRKQIRSDRVLSGVTLLGPAENLTQQALLQTFSQQVGPVHSLDALPDKVPYARYVMTGGAVTVTFDGGEPLRLQFDGGGYVRLGAPEPVEDAGSDLSGLFSSVIGQALSRIDVESSEQRPVDCSPEIPQDHPNYVERIVFEFENQKRLVLYSLLGHTVAGILCADGTADQIRMKALRRCLP